MNRFIKPYDNNNNEIITHYVLDDSNFTACYRSKHGEKYSDKWEDVNCYSCHCQNDGSSAVMFMMCAIPILFIVYAVLKIIFD